MLDQTLEYLESRQKKDPTFTYEVLVVDDGSKDKTTDVAQEYPISFKYFILIIYLQYLNEY